MCTQQIMQRENSISDVYDPTQSLQLLNELNNFALKSG